MDIFTQQPVSHELLSANSRIQGKNMCVLSKVGSPPFIQLQGNLLRCSQGNVRVDHRILICSSMLSRVSFNNYVNKLRWVGGQSIVYANKENNSMLFSKFVYLG